MIRVEEEEASYTSKSSKIVPIIQKIVKDYENEKEIFFRDHSNDIVKDELLIKLNSMPNVLITGHHALLTEEALTNIAATTIYNLDCWSENRETENELTNPLIIGTNYFFLLYPYISFKDIVLFAIPELILSTEGLKSL